MQTAYRTHTCGALRAADEGSEAVISGWVNVIRDQGGVLFVDVRDRHGLTQATFRGDRDPELLAAAEKVRGEWVVQVTGRVVRRPPEAVNAGMATGEIELEATKLRVLSKAETPPFPLDERGDNVSSEIRLRHRYLDLRRRRQTEFLAARAKISGTMRRHLEAQGFIDIETPTLISSTPEGARDYLVPSRVHPGSFYALPQSPQLFKQLLMIGGQDRYYQFARCYRDEDLRADRQPEFTQVDLEASFVEQEDLFALLEPCVAELIETWRGERIERPFQRLAYADVMARFGSDKPDLRNPLELVDVTAEGAALGFAPFTATADSGGLIKVLRGPGAGQFSRKEIDALEAEARGMGAPGLAWAKWTDGKATGPLARFLEGDAGAAFLAKIGVQSGDWFCCAAGSAGLVHRILGHLRDTVARKLELVDFKANSVLWVTDFPLVAWNEDEGRFDAMHHPFTSPSDEMAELLVRRSAGEPVSPDILAGMPSKAYDLVFNGAEVGGGSIRIHRADVQAAVFDLLAISAEEQERRFGWFVQALRYGTPPHGGLAFGFDRFVMSLLGEAGIQEVIAFPKTMTAADLLCRAPSPVDPQQLADLRLALCPDEAPADGRSS
ncbi:MAG: aspartate--tRNA ligase [Planctomycetota bacterium]|nr:aspartate--tRNA ligase [Planctomycetota bacterium]